MFEQMAALAKAAAGRMAILRSAEKDAILHAMADALESNTPDILAANGEDVRAGREKGLGVALIDRLTLSRARIAGMAGGLRGVAALPDPIGSADYMKKRPNGLLIECRRVPFGVVGIIYEARPNVTADAAGLCVKSGNCCILRGGKEALRSNEAIVTALARAGEAAGLPHGALQLVLDPSREWAEQMMRLRGGLDLLIPRGGAALIQSVVQNARVPVIETGVGNCHVYADAAADLAMALEIIDNAKTSRPAVCNAAETLLVHASLAETLLPALRERFAGRVELRGCEQTRRILPEIQPATERDWFEEYGDFILAVKTVGSLDEAIGHINRCGSGHSEAIITNDYANAQRFLDEIDAAAVYVNASTRFTDGEEFGFGAEIGISTQKLHARGPMGLLALTTVKYAVYGSGQIR